MEQKYKEFIDKVDSSNNEEYIKTIIKEFLMEFIEVHGDEHATHVVKRLEKYLRDIYYNNTLYNSKNTGICSEVHIEYYVEPTEKNNFLREVIKHELWHGIYDLSKSTGRRLEIMPHYYLGIEEKGCCKFPMEDEKWTEWLSKITHKKDMQLIFTGIADGYFLINKASPSRYVRLLNIADITSTLIEKEELLKAYLNSEEYDTGVTFSELAREFDNKYTECLGDDERDKYEYPQYMIARCSDKIYKNKASTEEVLSLYATLMRAYLIKVKEYSEFSEFKDIEKTYKEIKYIQLCIPWNEDEKLMENQEYISVLKEIENTFKAKCLEYRENNESEEKHLNSMDNMIDNLSYKNTISKNKYLEEYMEKYSVDNKFHKIKNEETDLISGIRGCIHTNIRLVLGDNNFYTMLYQQGEDNNLLVNWVKKVEGALNSKDKTHLIENVDDIYSELYSYYGEEFEDKYNLENITSLKVDDIIAGYDVLDLLIKEGLQLPNSTTVLKGIISRYENLSSYYYEYIYECARCNEEEYNSLVETGKVHEETAQRWNEALYKVAETNVRKITQKNNEIRLNFIKQEQEKEDDNEIIIEEDEIIIN